MRLGIDIGGTKTAALVLDASGEVVAHVSAASGRGANTGSPTNCPSPAHQTSVGRARSTVSTRASASNGSDFTRPLRADA